MPPPITLTRIFKLTALRPNGTGVLGAKVRLLNSNGNDVTAAFFNNPTNGTDASGVFERSISIFNQQPAGVYTIQVMAEGFEPWTFDTNFLFKGAGTFTANLTPQAFNPDYDMSGPLDVPLSSMVPIVFQVESANDYAFEYINATVTHPDNAVSVIQAPVDKTTHVAMLDVRNRVQLGIRPLLVGDGDLSRNDTDFSTRINVTFSSVSPETETELEGDFTRSVAHTLPPDGKTNLASYVASVREWIVPAQPVIAFRGYYRDVMIWLPDGTADGFTLSIDYFNRAGVKVATTTNGLTNSDYVQRIKLDTDPADGVTEAVLIILAGSTPVTKPLTVLYRD